MVSEEVADPLKQETHDCKHIMDYANKFPVLTAEQEKALFIEFRFHRNSVMLAYSFGLSSALLDHHVGEVKRIQDKLVNSNLRLVIKAARKFMGKGIHLIDLISYGIDGLIYTIQVKFRPELGFKLSTYATQWIKQRIRRALENLSKLVPIPGNVLAEITRLDVIYSHLLDVKKGVPPSPAEISEEYWFKHKIIMTTERIQELGRYKYQHVSLDDSGVNEETGISMLDFIVDDKNKIELNSEESENRCRLLEKLQQLNEKEGLLIAMKWGILDHREFSKKEICVRLKITPQEYTQIESAGMSKLQKLLNRAEFNLE